MTDFVEFVERQERGRYIRFTDINQASEIAGYFNATSFSVGACDDTHLRLTIEERNYYTGHTAPVTVDYGDYVIEGRHRDGFFYDYRVVGRREFHEKFEDAEPVKKFITGGFTKLGES